MGDDAKFLVGILVLLAIGGIVCWAVWSVTAYHRRVGWPLDQAREWLWRARASNDPRAMAQYVNESLRILGPLRGNPAWWYPRPDTDWDLIEQNLAQVRDQLLSHNLTDAMATQQLVHNTQETLVEIEEHVGLAEGKQKNWGGLEAVGRQGWPGFMLGQIALGICLVVWLLIGIVLMLAGSD